MYILFGVTQGGCGWVITPGGEIKPDPAPQPHAARKIGRTLASVLRAGMVATAAAQVTDRALRRRIRRKALEHAKAQLSELELPTRARRGRRRRG